MRNLNKITYTQRPDQT